MKPLNSPRRSLAMALLFLFLPTFLHAAQTNSGAGQVAAPWLQIPSSARMAGMGGAFGAMGGDIDTLDSNPAGLDQLDRPQLLLMHNAWFQGAAVEHFSGGLPLDASSGLGIGFDYLNAGSIDAYALSGGSPVPNGTLSPNAYNVELGYAMSLNGNFDLGVLARYTQQNLSGSVGGGALNGDWGVMAHGFIPRLSLGVGMADLGQPIQGSTLPSNLKLSLAYQSAPIGKVHAFNLAADGLFSLASGQAAQIGVGVEYWYNGLLALRAGDQLSDGTAGTGLNGLTFGAGLKVADFELDYAYMSNGDLGGSNLVSLLVFTGGKPKPQLTVKEVEILDSLKRNIQFEFDKAALVPEFAAQLDQLGDLLKKRSQDRVVLTGYASQEGSPEHNQLLSSQRAQVVRDRLLSRGLPADQVVSVGKGDSNPLVASGAAEDLAANRRVEITISQPRPGSN